jgi:hypothetical protein
VVAEQQDRHHEKAAAGADQCSEGTDQDAREQ